MSAKTQLGVIPSASDPIFSLSLPFRADRISSAGDDDPSTGRRGTIPHARGTGHLGTCSSSNTTASYHLPHTQQAHTHRLLLSILFLDWHCAFLKKTLVFLPSRQQMSQSEVTQGAAMSLPDVTQVITECKPLGGRVGAVAEECARYIA